MPDPDSPTSNPPEPGTAFSLPVPARSSAKTPPPSTPSASSRPSKPGGPAAAPCSMREMASVCSVQTGGWPCCITTAAGGRGPREEPLLPRAARRAAAMHRTGAPWKQVLDLRFHRKKTLRTLRLPCSTFCPMPRNGGHSFLTARSTRSACPASSIRRVDSPSLQATPSGSAGTPPCCPAPSGCS